MALHLAASYHRTAALQDNLQTKKERNNACASLQVVTTMDLISLDPVSLQPLQRFGYKDVSPAFKVGRLINQKTSAAAAGQPEL